MSANGVQNFCPDRAQQQQIKTNVTSLSPHFNSPPAPNQPARLKIVARTRADEHPLETGGFGIQHLFQSSATTSYSELKPPKMEARVSLIRTLRIGCLCDIRARKSEGARDILGRRLLKGDFCLSCRAARHDDGAAPSRCRSASSISRCGDSCNVQKKAGALYL